MRIDNVSGDNVSTWMKVIPVSKIDLVEKDVILIKNRAGFDAVWTEHFKGSLVFDLNGTLYLLGELVVYCYKEKTQ